MSYNISFLRAGSPSELSGILRQVKTKIESDKEKEKNVEEGGNGMGEKTSYKNLLTLDDMTAIADKTPNFGHFLTTCRKLNLSCMFFIIYIKDLKIGIILFPRPISSFYFKLLLMKH